VKASNRLCAKRSHPITLRDFGCRNPKYAAAQPLSTISVTTRSGVSAGQSAVEA
jgi:hypothetical protein